MFHANTGSHRFRGGLRCFVPGGTGERLVAQVKLSKEFTKRGGSGSAPARRKYTHTRVKEGFCGQIGVRLNCFDYLPIVNVWKK